jgi:hypothetical protein
MVVALAVFVGVFRVGLGAGEVSNTTGVKSRLTISPWSTVSTAAGDD